MLFPAPQLVSRFANIIRNKRKFRLVQRYFFVKKQRKDCAREATPVRITNPGVSSDPVSVGSSGSKGGKGGREKSDVEKLISEKAKLAVAKERRAARTMAVIVSTFVVCWLPFFLQV